MNAGPRRADATCAAAYRSVVFHTTRGAAMTRLLLASALLAFAGAASAQSFEADSKVQAEAKADAEVERYCIKETGTRIKQAARAESDKSRRDCVAGGGRVYTRSDIETTGRVDLADALRALDPSIR
jgi:hypothetical protein